MIDPSNRPVPRPVGRVEAVVLADGDPVGVGYVDDLPAATFVVAADGGLRLAGPLGLAVDLVIGDLDSVDPDQLDAAAAAGARVERHPVAKDATDLALALDAAVAAGATRVTVVGGAGGRADHLLANWLILAGSAYAAVDVRAWSAVARTDVVRAGRMTQLDAPVGSVVSLLPVHGPARGITTTGLRYPLTDGELPPGSSRGVSNQMSAPHATVVLTDGVLLAVRPLTHIGAPT
ncbi:MAG: thiamine diphosphokinase [Nitriliruptor sp.]